MDLKVSILIPVHNQVDYTIRCLQTLTPLLRESEHEVIVVDNGSTDQTSDALALFRVDRIIRFAENRGIAVALNAAARVARGEHLLFLNNDSWVRQGAIEALVVGVERAPDIGAVGAKLINPNGSLQEAGSIIWNDGTGYNYGADGRVDFPAYDFAREVDYCSAACLLVRRAAFEKVGGFDERFTPAYYEDTDLCFSLRAAGYRVMYEPRAEVVHERGITAGTDPLKGFKRYQEINRPKFVEKHRAALGLQLPPDLNQIPRARSRGTGLRILVMDHRLPRPDRDSGSLRMVQLLEILLEMGHQVTLLPDDLNGEAPYLRDLQAMGVEVVHGFAYPPDYLREHLPSTDLVILSRALIGMKYAWIIRNLSPRMPIVFDSVDLHFLRETRHATLSADADRRARGEWMRESELYLARICSRTWVVSDYEQKLLEREIADRPVTVVPNIHVSRRGVPPLLMREHLVFVGGFHHLPNLDGIVWFAREVFPLVRARLPGMRLRIVGEAPPPEVRALDNGYVDVLGAVPAIDPYLDAARLMVAPLRYGAGIKGKIGSALACGLPVVTTTVGAEGMGLVDGEHVIVADRPDEMAQRILDVYTSPPLWHRLSHGGRALIERGFTPDIVRGRIRDEIAALI